MKNYLLPLAGGSVVFALGLALGIALANSSYHRWSNQRLTTQVRDSLTLHVEAASRLRTGDVDGALTLLDQAIDEDVSTLPHRNSISELPRSTRQALMAARTYRAAFPAADPDPAAQSIYQQVPLLTASPDTDTQALAEIIRLAETQNTAPAADQPASEVSPGH